MGDDISLQTNRHQHRRLSETEIIQTGKHMEKNYKLIIGYDGTRYFGWEHQPGKDTIQGKLEDVLNYLAEEPVLIIGAGRTDAGVHAKGQVANFHIEEHFTEGKIMSYLNHYLPDDIAVIAIEQVDERFHSRYAAKKKTYRYHIHMGEISDVFERKYEYQYEKTLDVERMKEINFMDYKRNRFSLEIFSYFSVVCYIFDISEIRK